MYHAHILFLIWYENILFGLKIDLIQNSWILMKVIGATLEMGLLSSTILKSHSENNYYHVNKAIIKSMV